MSVIKNAKLNWSAYNTRTGSFDTLKPDREKSQEENNAYYADNASSVSIFTDVEAEIPEAMETLSVIKEALGWKGVVETRSCKAFEDRSGNIIENRTQVYLNREPSMRSTVGGFMEYIAGMAR